MTSHPTDTVKILYIVGSGRSGSTILDNVLGQLGGFFSGGELCCLWDRGLVQNRRCGCGVPFRECQTWRAVLARAFGTIESAAAHEVVRLAHTSTRTRHLPRHAFGRKPAPREYRDTLASLYFAIRDTTASRVIVDSSKSPSYAAVLDSVDGLDVRLVHLVRDPRASAYSWLRKKVTIDEAQPRHMRPHGPLASSAMWNIANGAAQLLWRGSPERYLMVRYEDFISAPKSTIRRILDFAGEPARELPFESERMVRLTSNHTVSGNPTRFRTGLVDLHPDEEWLTRMLRRDEILVTAMTLPLLGRLGYPIRPKRGSPRKKERALATP